MGKRVSSDNKINIDAKMMEAISSLKRAIGAPDVPLQPDFLEDHTLAHIFCKDSDSIDILQALCHQFVHGNKPVFRYEKNGKPKGTPVNFAFEQSTGRVIEMELHVPPALRLQFVERVESYIAKIIAPTKSNTITGPTDKPNNRPARQHR